MAEAAVSKNNLNDDEIYSMCDEAKRIIMETAEENTGRMERRGDEELDEQCKQAMEPMNEAGTILMNRTTRNTAEMYKILRKESKNLIKSKKTEAVEDKIINS